MKPLGKKLASLTETFRYKGEGYLQLLLAIFASIWGQLAQNKAIIEKKKAKSSKKYVLISSFFPLYPGYQGSYNLDFTIT